jgi:hypothetical protein
VRYSEVVWYSLSFPCEGLSGGRRNHRRESGRERERTHHNERHGLWLPLLAVTDPHGEMDIQRAVDASVDMDALGGRGGSAGEECRS